MNFDDFLRNLPIIVKAPNGVREVRNLVFSIALQGRLSEQRPNEVVEQYAAILEHERAESVRSRLPAGDRNLQSLWSPIPDSWKWTTLDATSENIHYGVTAKAVFKTEGTRFLRITDIQDGRVDWSSVPTCDANEAKLQSSLLRNGDILIARTGGTIGKTYLVENLDTDAVFASYLIRWIPLPSSYPPFIKLFTNSPLYWTQLTEATSGTGQPNVSASSLKRFMIPLPPLEEQKRIVAKVDELMRLCDRLEDQQQEREKLLPLLSRANHARLEAEASEANLQAIFSQSGLVSPDELENSICSLAVSGGIISSKKNDDIVSKVLEHYEIDAVYPADAPLLPKQWRWVRLGDATITMNSGWSPACPPKPANPDQWGVLKTTAVQTLEYLEHENKVLPNNLEPRPEAEVHDGDILLTRAGPSNRVGVICVARPTRPSLMISDKIIRLHLIQEILPDFGALALNTGYTSKCIANLKSGMAASQMNISQPKLRSVPIPLPPIGEQHLILERVAQLLTLVRRLAEQKRKRSEVLESFAKAAIAEITSTEFKENEIMKPPKIEVVTALKVGSRPKKSDMAPLAILLLAQKAEASAKTLWQLSGLEIETFYQQLKTEIANGWIKEDTTMRDVKKVEVG
jgi:type I restriction enzyme S subunit